MSTTSSQVLSALDQFLATNERRAYRMAFVATNSHADALDIVQDAMISLVEKYSYKNEVEWKPLFYRILNNQINNWHRKQKVKNSLSILTPFLFKVSNDQDRSQQYSDSALQDHSMMPDHLLEQQQSIRQLEQAVRALSRGQREVFFLRNWQNMSTREAAQTLNVSEGTIKTQYSRAMRSIKSKLDLP